MSKKRTPLEMPIWNSDWDKGGDIPICWYGEELTFLVETAFVVGMEEFVATERDKKFQLLFKKYRIPSNSPDNWKQLATEMAKEQYDGFKVRNPKTYRKIQHAGRSVKWTPYHLALLWCEVADIKLKNGGTDKSALLRICKKSFWRKMLYAESLSENGLEGKVKLLNKHLIAARKTAFVAEIDTHIRMLPANKNRLKINRLMDGLRNQILFLENHQKYHSLLEKLNR